MVQPNHLSAEQSPLTPILETMDRLAMLFRYVDVESVVADATFDEVGSSDHEQVYVLDKNKAGKNLVETEDDLAIVMYSGLEDAHKHEGGEDEGHLIVRGGGIYVIDGQTAEVFPGMPMVISSGTPHFSVSTPEQPFIAVVASSPAFDPNHIVELDRNNPRDAVTAELHDQYAQSA